MDTVKVTIGIPVYNGANFIKATLDSVYGQSFNKIEVIIIDDCSTDKSVDIIEEWLISKSANYKFIKNDKNLGLLKCSNKLLSLVNTKYFQLLGHDDIIYSNKIFEQVNILENSNGNVAMVYCNMNVIDSIGNKVSSSFFERAEYLGTPPGGNIYNELIKGNFINASSVLCKTNFVIEQGGYNEDLFFEDWPMWIKLSARYEILFIDMFLGAYRVSENSMIHSKANKIKVAINTFMMYENLLKSNYPNKPFLKLMISKFAIFCFKLKSQNATTFLGRALYYKFNLKILVYYILSFFNKSSETIPSK